MLDTFFRNDRSNPQPRNPDARQARQVAEALFKPRPQRDPPSSPAVSKEASAEAEQQPVRKPRILSAQPVEPQPKIESGKPLPPVKERKAQARKRTDQNRIPPSKFARIKAWATYGMSSSEIAEICGVSVEEIERVIS